MTGPLLVDTCACIFLVDGALSKNGNATLAACYAARGAVYVSPWTAWELSGLLRRGRLRSPLSATDYFAAILARPGFVLAAMPPEVLINSWSLPGDPPKDPADRIVAATARAYGYTVLTRDSALLEYAREGHLSAIAC